MPSDLHSDKNASNPQKLQIAILLNIEINKNWKFNAKFIIKTTKYCIVLANLQLF